MVPTSGHFSSSSRVASSLLSSAAAAARAPGEAWWWLWQPSSSRDPPRGAPPPSGRRCPTPPGGAHPRSRAWTTTARARPNARCRASRRVSPRTPAEEAWRGVERREMTSRERGTARPRHGCPEGHGSRGHRHRVVPEDPRVREGGSPSSLQRGAPEAGSRAARSSEEKADKSTMRSYSRRRRVFRPPTADATTAAAARARARAASQSTHFITLHTYRVTTSTRGRPSMKHETCHVEGSFPFRAARASAAPAAKSAAERKNVPIDAPPIVSDTQCLFPSTRPHAVTEVARNQRNARTRASAPTSRTAVVRVGFFRGDGPGFGPSRVARRRLRREEGIEQEEQKHAGQHARRARVSAREREGREAELRPDAAEQVLREVHRDPGEAHGGPRDAHSCASRVRSRAFAVGSREHQPRGRERGEAEIGLRKHVGHLARSGAGLLVRRGEDQVAHALVHRVPSREIQREHPELGRREEQDRRRPEEHRWVRFGAAFRRRATRVPTISAAPAARRESVGPRPPGRYRSDPALPHRRPRPAGHQPQRRHVARAPSSDSVVRRKRFLVFLLPVGRCRRL